MERNLRSALVESRQRYKDLVEVSSDFAWEVNEQGTFSFVSPEGALGFTPDDMVGHHPEDFVIDAEQYHPLPFHSDRPMESVEIWMKSANGKDACVVVSCLPPSGEEGEWHGARSICRNVTEEREREAALRSIVNRRLAEEPEEIPEEDYDEDIESIPPKKMKEARELFADGALNPDRLNEALQAGDRGFAAAALVLMSGLEEIVIMQGISMRSAKGTIAFAWKAKLEPWLVEQLQLRLSKIPSKDVLSPPIGQDYPTDADEMNGQINFLKNLAK